MADKKFTYADYEDDADTIASKKTWDTVHASNPGEFVFSGGDFDYSDETKNYGNQLQQWQKPGAFQYGMQQSLNDTINKILNGEKFSYDVNGDALYQQYKDQYVNQGKLAMMDTMGQAQAATGGYGNSYAQSVGQQAYQGYLQQLNDRVPELYQLALDKYNSDRADLYNQYGLLADRENTEYGRYRDTVSDAYNERDYLTNQYNAGKSWDYGLYSDSWDREHTLHNDAVSAWQYADSSAANNYWNQKNFGYGKYSDAKNFAYTEHRDDIADDQWQQPMDFNKDQASKSTSGGGGNYQLSADEWNDITSRCDTYIANKDSAGLKNYLAGLYNRGYITEDEYADFYEQFVPKVTTGGSGGGGGNKFAYHTLN